ncbi:hypothetical protein M0804_013836 [Polistes exclamans]|nr:hypothetical protein M0804_013836 [Polistes exclamans]
MAKCSNWKHTALCSNQNEGQNENEVRAHDPTHPIPSTHLKALTYDSCMIRRANMHFDSPCAASQPY